jgi:hypothetical protein
LDVMRADLGDAMAVVGEGESAAHGEPELFFERAIFRQ